MSHTTKRWAFSFIVAVVLALPLALSVAGDQRPTDRDDAKIWFASLSDQERIDAGATIATLSPAQQAIVLRFMSAEARASFWLERFKNLRRSASPEGQRTLDQAIALFSSKAYLAAPSQFNAEERQIVVDLIAHVGRHSLEPVLKAPVAQGARFLNNPVGWLRERVTVHAMIEDCDCSEMGPSSYCGSNQDCRSSAPCTVIEEGCWTHIFEHGACTGVCMITVLE